MRGLWYSKLRAPAVALSESRRSSLSRNFARSWSSSAARIRASSSRSRKGFLNSHEAKELERIERDNEIWRMRGKSVLPPALPVVCRKGRGQHLLKNSHITEAIVEKAGIRSTDTVLEIGPGTGNLTLRLLEVAKKVIAVEVDPRMVEELKRRVQLTDFADKLEIVHADILCIELPEFDICVANIPYKISSPLTFKLLGCAPNFRAAVLMLQREFARRLMATVGDPLFCRLSVNTQLLASIKVLMEVSKANFSPPPKVDSTVVCIRPHSSPPVVNFDEWNNFIRVCFSRKNKTLGAIFRQKHVLSVLVGPDPQALPDSEEASDDEESGEGTGSDRPRRSSTALSGDDDMSAEEEEAYEESYDKFPSHEELMLIKEKAIGALSAGGFENKRSVKLTQGDFLKLLAAFNEAGIKFG